MIHFSYLGSVVICNGKIQNEINGRIKKASQFYHLVKGLLSNKDINEKCKPNILKIYFKRILLYRAETWTTSKREDSKTQAMEIKFLRVILNKSKDRIRNTKIRLELEVDEIKNAFQNSRLR